MKRAFGFFDFSESGLPMELISRYFKTMSLALSARQAMLTFK
jgi:hypothetical protein